MKHIRRPALQIIASLLLPAILSSTLHAAETVRWADLPKKIGEQRGDRDFILVTKTGETYRSSTFVFSLSGVFYAGSEAPIPREEVAEIRIRHHGALLEPIESAVGMIGLTVAGLLPRRLLLITPIVLGAALAATPVAAVIEGGRRLAPAEVIKVAP